MVDGRSAALSYGIVLWLVLLSAGLPAARAASSRDEPPSGVPACRVLVDYEAGNPIHERYLVLIRKRTLQLSRRMGVNLSFPPEGCRRNECGGAPADGPVVRLLLGTKVFNRAVETSAAPSESSSTVPLVAALLVRSAVESRLPELSSRPWSLVFMDFPPEVRMEGIKRVMPWVVRVGSVCGDSVSELYVRRLEAAAASRGMQLHVERVSDRRKIARALASLIQWRMQVFLFLPDNLTGSRETLRYILTRTLRSGVPSVGFCRNYVKAGALYALVPAHDATVELTASALVRRAVSACGRGGESAGLELLHPQQGCYCVNRKVMRLLRIMIPGTLRRKGLVRFLE